MACSTPLPGAPRTPKRRRSHHVDRDREDGWLPRSRPVQKHHIPYSPIREAVKDLRRGQIHHFKRDGSPASRSQTQSQPRATKRVRHNGHGHVKRATPIGAAPERASSANSISQQHCSGTCAQLVYPDRSQLPSALSSSPPPPPSSITSNSDAPATATSNINKPAVTTQQPSTSSPASTTTTTTTMSYAAIAATAYTSTTCSRVVLGELPQQATASIPPATLEVDGENKAPSTAAAAPPKPIGRARSNTFYGRAQHTIVARQRSPPSSPTPPAAPPAPRLRSAAELAPEASSSRAANLRLALPSASSLTRSAVASMLERISAPPGLGLRAAAAAAAASGSGLGLTLDALPIMITTTTTESECSEPAPAPRRSAASPLLPAAPVPVGPSPDAAARDSRARLVAGLLLNRVRANAPPRCRRRPVASEVPRQYVSSCLRMEVVV